MASFTPYTYIQCPCHDDPTAQGRSADDASPTSAQELSDSDDDHAFDPRSQRSNFSLYPLEYLLYCDVCHQIRCPRCVTEEIVTIYCPNCLFEVGSSSLKTEGNRCTRSCFQCPICIGPLAVQALESAPEPSLLSADRTNTPTPAGPWILTCSYCHWNSSEIGVKFDKPQGIFGQLQKLRYGEEQSKHVVSGDTSPTKSDSIPQTHKARFSTLKSFYGSQTVSTNPGAGLSGLGDYGLNSPGALTRIMSIYSGNNLNGLKQKNKSTTMREAETASEGFRPSNLDESAAISQLRRDGWDGTVTRDQAKTQVEEGAKFADQLWPIPYLLRTKRSKRCPVCRHIISKPESKVSNTRWRIRLVANNSIPSISIKPLNPPPGSGLLTPLQPAQFLLTFKNALFDDVKVTLATPATTPGRFASRVTVLCPEFQIDANPDNDMYLDDVLRDGDKERQRQRGDESIHQAEAGKIWERGRNWVSIVVEVVPASLRTELSSAPPGEEEEGEPEPDLSPLKEDEDILEIPMFVRLEWESEASQDQVGTTTGREKDAKEKRELAYWCAIGIGRISQE
ncbi:dynactin p62 family-domain-containing protein [Xylaria cf. heliscus]|nr:dynactin p62 family-domain-containing protein [Xylaria cf. heliscus]